MTARSCATLATAISLGFFVAMLQVIDCELPTPRMPLGISRFRYLHDVRTVNTSHVEVYMVNSEFGKLRNDAFLENSWEYWPEWVFTVLSNYMYCKRHGYQMSMWVPPPTEVSGYWSRGWGNVLVGQYITERLAEGSYPATNWLVYMENDYYFGDFDTSLGQFLSTTPIRKSIGKPLLHNNQDFITSLDDTSLLQAGASLDSKGFLLNIRNDETSNLLSEWSHSAVTGNCHMRHRVSRCLRSLCTNNATTASKYGNLVGTTQAIFGKTRPSEHTLRSLTGISTQSEAVALMTELLDSVMVRDLPMRLGDKSPQWRGTFAWPTIDQRTSSALTLISQHGGYLGLGFSEYPSKQPDLLPEVTDAFFPSDSSESCLVVVITANPRCLLVIWLASESLCYCASDSVPAVTLNGTRDVLTWVNNGVQIL